MYSDPESNEEDILSPGSYPELPRGRETARQRVTSWQYTETCLPCHCKENHEERLADNGCDAYWLKPRVRFSWKSWQSNRATGHVGDDGTRCDEKAQHPTDHPLITIDADRRS